MVANYSNLEGMKFIELLMAYPSDSTGMLNPTSTLSYHPSPYVHNLCYTSKFGEKRLKTQQSKLHSKLTTNCISLHWEEKT